MPHGTSKEGGHGSKETRLLARRGYPQVYVVPQPVIRVDVPGCDVSSSILGQLQFERLDIDQAIPTSPPSFRVDSSIPNPGEDAGTFRQRPYSVELRSHGETEGMQEKHSLQEAVLEELVREHEC
jgi:hypothetical protein